MPILTWRLPTVTPQEILTRLDERTEPGTTPGRRYSQPDRKNEHGSVEDGFNEKGGSQLVEARHRHGKNRDRQVLCPKH